MSEYNILINKYDALNAKYDQLYPAIKPKEYISYAVVTMLASNWSNKTYSFEADYPNADYNITISVSSSATYDEYQAFTNAMICGSADSNVVTAIGDTPAIDIPILIEAVKK